MSMFCYQCQETARNLGCTIKGVCGKTDDTANLQDMLIYNLQGISVLMNSLPNYQNEEIDDFIVDNLFATITNANFDKTYFEHQILKSMDFKAEVLKHIPSQEGLPKAALWITYDMYEIRNQAGNVGVLQTADENVRSLRYILLYGLKGICAYADHAYRLGYKDQSIFNFVREALGSMQNDKLTIDEQLGLVMKCGEYAVKTMALLDSANTMTYGNPEPTEVNIGVGKNPGILISGHDLKDMEELLLQTEGTGIDVYTHGEMLPANYYPAFKKYKHFVGNYGGSWWKQTEEFESFNGPVILTSNCLVPPKESYKDRVFTTGTVGFEGLTHIPDSEHGKHKDFSGVIKLAKQCKPPIEIETGKIIGGFAHDTVLKIADKVLDAVKNGAIKKFVVMGGCDGRQKQREYYTDFAKALPSDTVILTAGCAKFRYNKLNLGDIGGIPRVLDAGQCNDSYSLVVIALKLAEVLNVGVNDLPIVYNIAWYEQKAVAVLLALLYLGVKNIHLGNTLPAFVSPSILNVLVEKFQLAPISDVDSDIKLLIG